MYFVSTSDDEESPLMCHDNNILLGARMLSLILVSWLVEHCGHLLQVFELKPIDLSQNLSFSK